MKLKSILASALAAALIFSCLAGCGKQQDAETESAAQVPAESAAETLPESANPALPTEGADPAANPEQPGTPDSSQQGNLPMGPDQNGQPMGPEQEGQMPMGPDQNGQTPMGPGGMTLPENLQPAQVTAIDGQTVTLALGTADLSGGRGQMPQGQDGQMPQMPQGQEGQMPQMPEGQDGQMPQMPQGQEGQTPQTPQGQDGQMPQMPEGQDGQMPGGDNGQAHGGHGGRGGMGFTASGETVTAELDQETVSSLSVGDLVLVTLDDSGAVTAVEPMGRGGRGGFPGGQGGFGPQNGQGSFDPQGGGMGGFPGGQGGFGPQNGQGGFDPQGGQGGSRSNGTAANTAEADVSGAAYTSAQSDENALRVSGSTVTLTDLTLNKTGDGSNTETCDFYGMNAGLLAADGAAVTVNGGSFTTDGAGANALFCYGSGTSLTVRDAVIRTSGRNSGGLQTAGGGVTTAENLDVETQGASAAAIRSDRGGGTVTVTGGSYVTHGTGSPAIYSTADVTVNDAALTATASEAVVVEGKNSVTLNNCDVSGAMEGTYGEESGENLQTVMIYQSMSGDADVGKGSFSMTGGSLTGLRGDLFYVTNTTAAITLEDVALTPGSQVLLRVAGNDGSRGWGARGSNGGTVTLEARRQQLTGTILVDEISSLELTLGEGSSFTGTVNPDGGAGLVRLTLEDGCTWSLTGDAHLTTFTGDVSAIETNGFHVYVGNQQLV